jgi:hypothetical protein
MNTSDEEATEGQSSAGRLRALAHLRHAILCPGTEREKYTDLHPLNNRPLYILTVPIKTIFLEVVTAIKRKRPGYSNCAEFRQGKSTAWVMIKREIKEVLPTIAFGLVAATGHAPFSERNLWGELLDAHELPLMGTSQDRHGRFKRFVISSCITAGGKHFVLFIDEGQNWGTREYTCLRDLETQLHDHHDLLLTTVVVGDPSLQQLSDSFRASRKDLWSRFMIKPTQFPGTNSLTDLSFYMAEHDSPVRCEYPAGSGISYTEFFMPQAFKNGWRLAAEAQLLWDAYARSASTLGRSPENIGMQWVTESIVNFLSAQTARDAPDFASDSADWDAAVLEANYLESLI